MHCLLDLLKRKDRKNSSKDDVATVERLDTKQLIVLTRKARKKRTLKTNPTKETQKPKKDSKGKGKTDMTKIKCYNCGEMGHFAWNCPKPRENANLARENEQNSRFTELMDLGDSSVCEECAMICTDAYSDEEYEEMVVYGDQGITSKNFDEEMYGDLMNTDSDKEPVNKYNVALCAHNSVSLEKKRRQLNRDIPSEDKNQLSLINKEADTAQGPTNHDDEIELQKAWTMGMPMIGGDISTMDSEELECIKDNNKKFLYARAVHANHMIQHHMHKISECQRLIDEYHPWSTEEGK